MAGLLGVGGGIIIVPISYFVLLYLDYSSDYAMHIAIASSLGIICFTSISSIRTHIKLHNVNFVILRIWAPGIVLGSIIGSYRASLISGEVLVNILNSATSSVVEDKTLMIKNWETSSMGIFERYMIFLEFNMRIPSFNIISKIVYSSAFR